MLLLFILFNECFANQTSFYIGIKEKIFQQKKESIN